MEEEISRPSSPTEEDDIQGSPELTNKKGKRQSKKSSAKMAEIERRENHIKHLLKMGSLPESINEWLKEEVSFTNCGSYSITLFCYAFYFIRL